MNSEKQRDLVILGGGFAGVWAALAAARRRRELGLEARIRVVSPSGVLGLRPRFYEDDLARSQVELARLFGPTGIEHVADRAVAIDPDRRTVTLERGELAYDALVLAAGSAIVRPAIPGAEHLASVDTLGEAQALRRRLQALGPKPAIVVVGGGFTGIETATELMARVPGARITLVERAATIATEYGPKGRAIILEALAALGISTRVDTGVVAIGRDEVTLATGDVLPADVVIWSAGVRAHGLGRVLGDVDPLGRVPVDAALQVEGHSRVWAAGDAARVSVDGEHLALMSCQHAMPQGRFAGHNAMSALAGASSLRYAQHAYLTCLDLGPWGALVTRGFAREDILCAGPAAKPWKRFINTSAIYPPLDGDAATLLRAARPSAIGPFAGSVLEWLVGVSFVRNTVAARAVDGPAALGVLASEALLNREAPPAQPRS